MIMIMMRSLLTSEAGCMKFKILMISRRVTRARAGAALRIHAKTRTPPPARARRFPPGAPGPQCRGLYVQHVCVSVCLQMCHCVVSVS